MRAERCGSEAAFFDRLAEAQRASWARRFAADALHATDYAVLSLPGLRKLGGMVVISATISKPALAR